MSEIPDTVDRYLLRPFLLVGVLGLVVAGFVFAKYGFVEGEAQAIYNVWYAVSLANFVTQLTLYYLTFGKVPGSEDERAKRGRLWRELFIAISILIMISGLCLLAVGAYQQRRQAPALSVEVTEPKETGGTGITHGSPGEAQLRGGEPRQAPRGKAGLKASNPEEAPPSAAPNPISTSPPPPAGVVESALTTWIYVGERTSGAVGSDFAAERSIGDPALRFHSIADIEAAVRQQQSIRVDLADFSTLGCGGGETPDTLRCSVEVQNATSGRYRIVGYHGGFKRTIWVQVEAIK